MFIKYHNNRYLVFLTLVFIGLFFLSNPALGFYGEDRATIDQIILKQDLQQQKLDFIENNKIVEDQSIKNLITGIDLKKDIANEKENAYEKAINELKWWFAGFATFAIGVLIFFGMIDGKRLRDTKKELTEDLERKKLELHNIFNNRSDWLKEDMGEKVENMREMNRVQVREEIIGLDARLEEMNKKSIEMIRREIKDELEAISDFKSGKPYVPDTEYPTTDENKSVSDEDATFE